MSQIDPLSMGLSSAAIPAATKASLTGEDFSSFYMESMACALSESTLSPLGGASPPLPDDSFGYLQSMLFCGAAGGQTNGSEMLIYMLLCMMQEFKNSDIAPLMTALAALAPNTASASFSPTSFNPTSFYPNLYSPGTFDSAFLPEQAWLPVSAHSISTAFNRSAEDLNKVISQFCVESAGRYRRRNGNTYCNIFVWDVTRALGCEIPHYVDKESGDARYYPDIKGAYEQDANATCDWLLRRGADYGWREITAQEAQNFANAGFPVVSAWRNKNGGAGHVQIVCPARGGGYDPLRGVTVAQAGSRNFTYAHINVTMSADKIAQTRYFVHD
jgi:hypothetical protein